MARRGENIRKRKDGRWEGRYIKARTPEGKIQWGYVYVQRWMTSYNAIYGSFAALPLLLIWLQTSWQILLFGGELSFAYQNIARFGEERESLLISYDQRRKILLAVMLTVVWSSKKSSESMVGGVTLTPPAPVV